jgi:hypothetical protein
VKAEEAKCQEAEKEVLGGYEVIYPSPNPEKMKLYD